MRQMTGKQSISFAKAVYIEGSAAIVGEKEKDGPLGEYFSHTLSDPMCGQESWSAPAGVFWRRSPATRTK